MLAKGCKPCPRTGVNHLPGLYRGGATPTGIEDKLKELGITLPPAPCPATKYVPWVREGDLLFLAGQVPLGPDGKLQFIGKVGQDWDEKQGY